MNPGCRPRPTVPDVAPLVVAYYAKPENGAGGHCHIVLDDGNVTDDDVRFCLEECEREGDEDGAALMRLFLEMTKTQRHKAREAGP